MTTTSMLLSNIQYQLFENHFSFFSLGALALLDFKRMGLITIGQFSTELISGTTEKYYRIFYAEKRCEKVGLRKMTLAAPRMMAWGAHRTADRKQGCLWKIKSRADEPPPGQ